MKPKVSVIIPTIGRPSLADLLYSLKGQPFDELIVELSDKSPAQNRNNGARRATGDILIFLDDDITVARDFIEKGLKGLENNDFGQSRVVGQIENSYNKFIGTAMWFKKHVFDHLDGFHEGYSFFNEDLDMYQRAMNAGFQYHFFDQSLAFHPKMGTYEKLVAGNQLLKEEHPKLYKSLEQEIR